MNRPLRFGDVIRVSHNKDGPVNDERRWLVLGPSSDYTHILTMILTPDSPFFGALVHWPEVGEGFEVVEDE